MKKINIILSVLLLIITLTGFCVINKSDKLFNTMNEINDSTKQNRSYYAAQIYSSNCNFDLRINDMYVYKYLEPKGGISMQMPVNCNILESGIQTISVRIFPISGTEKLSKYASFDVEIRLYKDVDDPVTDYESVLKYTLEVPEEGIPSVEYSDEFSAEVPYEIDGWKNSVNLHSIDGIEDEIMSKYNEIFDMFRNKDIEGLEEIFHKKDKELAEVFYYSEDESREVMESIIEVLNDSSAILQTLEEGEIKYYADGRVVSLELKNGESAFRYVFRNEGENDDTGNIHIFIHKPIEEGDFEVVQ